jgi:hypothetical protein
MPPARLPPMRRCSDSTAKSPPPISATPSASAGYRSIALGDTAGGLAAFEQRLALSRDLAELRKGNIEAQTDLVVGLYKVATVAVAERKEAVIDEGVQILARLDADGNLTDDQKVWGESFLALRSGSQEAGATNH